MSDRASSSPSKSGNSSSGSWGRGARGTQRNCQDMTMMLREFILVRIWGGSVQMGEDNTCGLSCCRDSPFGGGRKAKEESRKDMKTDLWFSS